MSKVFIIAEIGINANGSVMIAKQLIDGAKAAGVDAVKFQKRIINKVYTKTELDRYRESPFGTTNRQQKIGLEFNKEEYDEINRYCIEEGIEWFASAWDLSSVEFLTAYDLDYNKIASPMLTHKSLLEAIAKQKKYTFISTGMSTLEEIQEAILIFMNNSCPFELMHCNSQYPMLDKDANLNCIKTLQTRFNCKVGYSGHEVGLITSVAAVAIGATSIERHITLDRSIYGSDQAASVEIEGLKRLVRHIRDVEVALGDGIKKITPAEEKGKTKLRRTEDVKT